MTTQLKKKFPEFLGDKAILVIEPSTNYRTSIKQFLTNLKVKHMKFVSTVAEARREMLTLKVAFFICEWGLDETNGLQFCRALRKEPGHKETPFLLLSTENLRKDIILASEVRIDSYLLKPFSYEDFCGQISLILKNHVNPSKLATILDEADAALARDDLMLAETLFDQALILRDSSARALTGLARIHRLKDSPEAAMSLLRQATAANPEYIESYRLMLEVCEEKEDVPGIVHAASALHQLSPENPRYTLILARTYLEASRFQDSEIYFKKTIALSPRMAEAYKGLGHVYVAQEEYEKAMKNFKKALDLDENDISTLNSLGMTYIRLGQYKEGIDKYMVALKLDPHDPRVLFNIGHAHEKRSDPEKAKWYYAQALIHKAGFVKAIRGLERIEKLVGEVGKSNDEPEAVPSTFKKSS